MPNINLGDIDLSNLMTYLYIIIGIAILAGILGGFMKGLKKTIYTTVIYIGVYIGVWLALPFVVELVYDLNIGELIKPYYAMDIVLFQQPLTSIKALIFEALDSFVPAAQGMLVEGSEALALIEGTTKMVVRIVLFFVLIIVATIVINIIGRILWTLVFKRIFGDTRYKDKDKTKKRSRSRLLGAAVGAVKGLFEALIIIVPIGGLMSIMGTLDSDTLYTLLGEPQAQQTSYNELAELPSVGGIDAAAIVRFIEEYQTSILAQVVSQIKVGSEQKQIDYYIIDELAKIETSGNRVIYLREEVIIILDVISDFPEVFSGEGIDPFNLGEERITEVIEKLKQSKLLPELIVIGVDYALNMEEVTTIVNEYDIDITVLDAVDWFQEYENLLNIGGSVLMLGNPNELDYFNIDPNKITNITTSIAASQIVNIVLPIAVNYALNLPEVQELLGEIEYDFDDVVWGDEIIAIGDIYIIFTDLGLTSPDEITVDLLNRLEDEVFFEKVIDLIGAFSSSTVITQLVPALADYAINSAMPEDFQGILSFRNLQPEDWQDEFRRLLNIVVAVQQLGLLSGEPLNLADIDIDLLRTVIGNLFDLVIIQGNEQTLVKALFSMIPTFVEGFEPYLDSSLNWKEQALQFVNIIEAIQELGVFGENGEFNIEDLLAAGDAKAIARLLREINHSLILREIIPTLINNFLGGGESSPIEMGISLEDFLSEWLTTQTTIDPITEQKIPMASIEEWDAEITYISRMLIIAMKIMSSDMSDLTNLALGDKTYNAATVEEFDVEGAGFAQLLYLMNYAQSFKIEGIRTLLASYLVGEESLISTDKELGIVTPVGEQTITEAWNDEIVALITVLEEAQSVFSSLGGGEGTDFMSELSDPDKVERILQAFNDSQVLRVVLPDLIYTLLDSTGMQDWATTWLSDQVGIDEFGENNPTASISQWQTEIVLLARAISGINSVLGGGFGGDLTSYNLGNINNHPMLPDYSGINPDFDTETMGLAEILFLVNHVRSLNIDQTRDLLGEFLVGEGSLVDTEKELGEVPGTTPLEKTQNWDSEIIIIIDILSQYNELFGGEESGDFLSSLTDSSKIKKLLSPINESYILREILPDMINTILVGAGTSELDGWFTDWLDGQVGVDGLGNNKPVASKADWDDEIDILADLISVFNNGFGGALPSDISTINTGDVNNHPILLGEDYDDTNPGMAELLYLMNYSKLFNVSQVRTLISDFIVGPGKLIETTKELGDITAVDEDALLLAWNEEIQALIRVIENYNTLFADVEGGNFLEKLTDKAQIENLLGNFNNSIMLREVLPDLLYSVLPSDIVIDWVDTWLIDQVGVDGEGENKVVASIAEWNAEIEKLAGMIEAYNVSFSAGFTIDLETMNLGNVNNNPRILGEDYDNASPGLAEILYFMNQSKSFKVDEIRNILEDFLIGPGNLIDTAKELGTVTAATLEDLVIAWDDEIYALISVMESYNSTFAGGGDFLEKLDNRAEIETLLGRFNNSIMLREVLPDMIYSVLPAEIIADWVDSWLVDQVGVDGLGDDKPVQSIAIWEVEISNLAGMIEAYNISFSTGFTVDLATMPLGDVDNNPRILGNAYNNTSPGLAEMLYFMNQSKSFKVDEIRNILDEFLIGPGNLITTDKELGTVIGGTPETLMIAWDEEIYALVSVMENYNTTFAGGGNFLEKLDNRVEIETLLGRFNDSIMLREVLPDMVYSVLPAEIVSDWVDTWLIDQVGVDGIGNNKPVVNIAAWTVEISNIAGMIETYNKSFSTGFTVDLASMPLGDVDNNPRVLENAYDNTSPGLAEMLSVGPGKLINTPKELGTVTAGTPEALIIAWDDEIKDLITAIEKYNVITGSGLGTPLDLFSALNDESTISDVLGAFNASVMLHEVLPDLINDIATTAGMSNWISTWLTNQTGVDGFGDNNPTESEAVWAVEVVKIATVIAEANNGFGGDMSTLDITAVVPDDLGSVLHAMNDTNSFVLDELNNIMKNGLNSLGYNITDLNDKPSTKAEWTTEIDAIVSIITDMQIIGDVAVLDWDDMDSLMVDNSLDPVVRDIDATTRQVTRGELLGLMLNSMGDSIILSPAMDQIIGSIFTNGGFGDYVDLDSIDLSALDWVDEIRAISDIKADFDVFDGGADLRTFSSAYIEGLILNASQGVISSQIIGTVLMDQFALILGVRNPIDPATSEPYDWRDKDDLAENAAAIGNMIALGEALAAMFGGNIDDNYEAVGNAMMGLQPDVGVDRPAFADIYLPAFVDYASGEDGLLDSVDMTTVDYVLEGTAFIQFFEDWDRSTPLTSADTLPGAYETLTSSGAQVSVIIVDSILS